jgi:hypothetical protein
MWQQNLGASGFRPQAPNPSDWANVAAQWLENKKFYEQWQQQQYQQHMQMMAASHAAQMAQSIDPSVITDPPPPPPEPAAASSADGTTATAEASEGKLRFNCLQWWAIRSCGAHRLSTSMHNSCCTS